MIGFTCTAWWTAGSATSCSTRPSSSAAARETARGAMTRTRRSPSRRPRWPTSRAPRRVTWRMGLYQAARDLADVRRAGEVELLHPCLVAELHDRGSQPGDLDEIHWPSPHAQHAGTNKL